jgi:hypothetical protein
MKDNLLAVMLPKVGIYSTMSKSNHMHRTCASDKYMFDKKKSSIKPLVDIVLGK